jgi:hypothetical protein
MIFLKKELAVCQSELDRSKLLFELLNAAWSNAHQVFGVHFS